MSEWISANWGVIGNVLLVLALVAFALIARAAWRNYRIREALKLQWMLLRCRFPWAGLTSRLARKHPLRLHMMPDETLWPTVEVRICSQFRKICESSGLLTPESYSNARSYLRKAGEAGRKELGALSTFGILALIAVEALILALVVSGYTVPGSSEAIQTGGAFIIGTLLAAVLMFLTHQAGKEWHLRRLVSSAREKWESDDRRFPLCPEDKRDIEIDEDGYDDEHPAYHQMTRRIRGNRHFTAGFPGWLAACLAFIVFLAYEGYSIRQHTYEQQRVEQAQPVETEGLVQDNSGAPVAAPAPAAPDASAPLAASAAETPEWRAHSDTFLLLAVLFCALQLISAWVNFHFGFAGIHSKAAARIVNCFSTLGEYEAWRRQRREGIVYEANEALSQLRSKQDRYAHKRGWPSGDQSERFLPKEKRTFERYLQMEQQEGDGGGERIPFTLAERETG